jgi:hypothetical protein
MSSQKDQVFAAYEVANEEVGSQGIVAVKERTRDLLVIGLMSGEITWGSEDKSEKQSRIYAAQLVCNWFKKDPRINGGVAYIPETKRGPRVTDEQLKKLVEAKKAAAVHAPELVAQLDAKIVARKEELNLTKATAKVMSVDDFAATIKELGL